MSWVASTGAEPAFLETHAAPRCLQESGETARAPVREKWTGEVNVDFWTKVDRRVDLKLSASGIPFFPVPERNGPLPFHAHAPVPGRCSALRSSAELAVCLAGVRVTILMILND